MLDPFLTEALARLDAWLLRVCSLEESRARRLAPNGAAGWDGVRDLARPTAAELSVSDVAPAALVPSGHHGLSRARGAFRLSEVEAESLLVLLAPHLEPRYRALYAVLQDDLAQPWTTERLLLTVLGTTGARRRTLLAALGPEGSLVGTGLVTPEPGRAAPLGRVIDLGPDVRMLLAGISDGPSAAVVPAAEVVVVHGAGEREEVAAADAGASIAVLRLREGEGAVDLARAAWRRAGLTGTPALIEVTGDATPLAGELLRLVGRHGGGRIYLSVREPLPVAARHLEARAPTFAQRVRGWQEAAALHGVALDGAAAGRLAAGWRLGPRAAGEVVRSASDRSEAGLAAQAARLAPVGLRHAIPVEVTRTLDDLVLRDVTRNGLERLLFYVQHRDRIAEERGLEARYRMRRGPIVLFSGRPGTGKTLAAEAMANALRRPLCVVDLSRLVSKYIGETEKNIDEVLGEGERSGAVLFFDEADALFSTRTEVGNSNDRFANLEVGYLLQRIERHDGLVVLATNLRQSIDEAFLRRFHARIEFPFPEPDERRRIWELMLPPSVPRAGSLALDALARKHRLSGGDIRNAALKAIFLAEQAGEALAQRHVEQAIALEMLELGRLSRRPRDPEAAIDRGGLVREIGEGLQQGVEAWLEERFLKEVHVIHGAPTKEALAGKRPAVSIALYRLVAGKGNRQVRLGFVVSAWSQRAEEEAELLGVVHEALCALVLPRMDGVRVVLRIQESYDFDLLHRFWSSHAQPVRPSVVAEIEAG